MMQYYKNQNLSKNIVVIEKKTDITKPHDAGKGEKIDIVFVPRKYKKIFLKSTIYFALIVSQPKFFYYK